MERKQSSDGLLGKRNGESVDAEECSGWAKRMRLVADQRQTTIRLASRQSDQFTATKYKMNEPTIKERTLRILQGT